MPPLPVGAQAPDLTAEKADGSAVKLSDLRGRYVLVYFYPRAGSVGCTREACELNDGLDNLNFFRADVIGVNRQSKEVQRGFRQRHHLRFALGSDPDGSLCSAYGVPKYAGLLPASARTSFLIDPDGVVVKVWSNVKPAGHAAEVLRELERQTAEKSAALPGTS